MVASKSSNFLANLMKSAISHSVIISKIHSISLQFIISKFSYLKVLFKSSVKGSWPFTHFCVIQVKVNTLLTHTHFVFIPSNVIQGQGEFHESSYAFTSSCPPTLVVPCSTRGNFQVTGFPYPMVMTATPKIAKIKSIF